MRAQDFSTLPFDHLVFTGSADAGRTVMRAAAENLTPVTLELGGKSPTIICDDYDVDAAAANILYGKFINAGQTCLAPDYLFVPEGKRDQFVAAAQAHRRRPLSAHRRPELHLDHRRQVLSPPARDHRRRAAQGRAASFRSCPAPSFDDALRKIPPQLVLDPTDDMQIMQEEIFGPLFPVMTYRTLDEVLAYIGRPRPPARPLLLHQRQGGRSRRCSTARSPAA